MTRQITFKGASEMPEIAISRGHMDWNKTGAWRTQRPFYQDKTPPCNAACPAGNDIVLFIQKIIQGDVEGAWNLIKEENPFPGVCGRVCFHPCESNCNRGRFDEPIAIHALERFVSDVAHQRPRTDPPIMHRRKEKIAIIGSGPAGMTCAYHLARLGYPVTVFESSRLPGGMLRVGIPPYRLPREVLDREISEIEALGVEIRTNTPIGRTIPFGDLREYQAVLIATGAHRGRDLRIPGEKGPGVQRGLDFLRKINLTGRARVGERVIIVGGGNTAMDVARAVIRLGKEATILYRRSRQEMPAFEEEIAEALEEGVKIKYLVSPVRIAQRGGQRGVECLRMKLGEKDESGRRRPEPVPNSNFFLEADSIIVAAGEEIDVTFLPQGIGKKDGILVTHADGRTALSGIFAGGDVASTDRTVAYAIGSGKKVAMAIDCYLNGTSSEEAIRQMLIGEGPSLSIFKYLHPGQRPRSNHIVRFEELNTDYFTPQERVKEKKRPLRERRKGFVEVTFTISEDGAQQEAERCFSCGTCNDCETCYLFCGDASIVKMEGKIAHQVDYDYCKGCGVCFVECPRGAISLQEEAR